MTMPSAFPATVAARRFRDRREAGRALADRLLRFRDERPVVLGLPRGGVPVAFEVARALGAPLDVLVVRKLGVPFQPELGMGAIGEDGARVLDPDTLRLARVTRAELAAVEARERAELERRVRLYRGDRPMTSLEGRTAIVVDDGIATGGTARAALQVVRSHGARRVVLAVPVAAPESVHDLAGVADAIVTVETPTPFLAVGQWYERFGQTTDEEVRVLLGAADGSGDDADDPPDPRAVDDPPAATLLDDEVVVRTDGLRLAGHLVVPSDAAGLVVFAHGSGSSRHSPRNRLVANRLHEGGLATLLFDLLTPDEALDRANVFDVELLAVRLLAATGWARRHPACATLPVGYFGASTGAAAALWAAAEDHSIGAVVSRGGRPDLAASRLAAVHSPTLLIVGGADTVVLRLNEAASTHLRCEHRIAVVRDATHLFEEPGTLETAADLATTWFARHLAPT
jgi:predicted phosphoribosyltransferase/predicted alpha/beta-hydrolase family hydrolase